MPGPHVLKYVVPLFETDVEATFLIYDRVWYRIKDAKACEAKWQMWEVTCKADQWWRPKTWRWVGSKRLFGPDEASVTDFWPYLSESVLPGTMAVFTFNSWTDQGGSDTWVKDLSDEGPVWWAYHCSEPKEGIFWRKAHWSGGQAMDWRKMMSPKAKSKPQAESKRVAKSKL